MSDRTPPPLPDGRWSLAPDGTTVTVAVKKLGFLDVPATLDLVDGSIVVTDGVVTSVDARVRADSYRSSNPKRDDHVTGPDFLDAAAHPELTFRATAASAGTTGPTVAGTVAAKGTSAPITFDVDALDLTDSTATFTASAHVDRSAVGVSKLPGFVIGRTLAITVEATATHTTDTTTTEHGAEA